MPQLRSLSPPPFVPRFREEAHASCSKARAKHTIHASALSGVLWRVLECAVDPPSAPQRGASTRLLVRVTQKSTYTCSNKPIMDRRFGLPPRTSTCAARAR